MKRINPILALVCVALYFLHGLLSAGFITGRLPFGSIYKNTGIALFSVLMVHAAIGIASMVINIRLRKKSGTPIGWYGKQNVGYYAQRITGVLLIVFAILHINSFGYTDASGYHLNDFNNMRLFLQLALTFSASAHLLFSMRASLISLKVDTAARAGRAATILFGICIVAATVVMAAAAIVYRSNF